MRRAADTAYIALLFVTFGVAAETTARLDDWVSSAIPVLAGATAHEDLTFNDGVVTRGAPGAVHRKWKLNQYGFRGREITEQPRPGVTRVMVLGASEAFGLYESKDMEFPAVVERTLNESGAFEVINAAVPGMTVRSMKRYWETWAARFAPSIVILYPSPQFYLNMGTRTPNTSTIKAAQPTPARDRSFKLRIADRIEDVFEYPMFIQRRRDARRLEELLQAQDPGSRFAVVPTELVTTFQQEVGHLVDAIRARGATCILVTHTMRATVPVRQEDLPLLESARLHVPLATASVIAEFEDAAARAIREYAAVSGVPLSDAARELGGKGEYFADLVHFTDQGSMAMAQLLARDLMGILHTRR